MSRVAAWFRSLFAPTITVTRTYSNLTPKQQAAFDRAFKRLDDTIAELDEVFKP